MNILIPIAGVEVKSEDSQYIKGLYEIENKIIIQHIYESLNKIKGANFIFVIKREDVQKFHLDNTLKLLNSDVRIIITDGNTEGSACSCLLAVDYIDSEEPLIISGADQIITRNWSELLDEFSKKDYDGGVICFESVHPKWSYVKLDEAGFVVEAAEKHPISHNATTGQYYFKKGSDFVHAAKQMILKGANVNGQYFVCPTFNELVLKQKKIGVIKISQNEYFSLKSQKGIDEYEKYLKKENQQCR